MNLKNFILVVGLVVPLLLAAQSMRHEQSATYVGPSDPLVKEKLEQWRDLKFGIIFHWGLYSVPGIVESWQLTSEDWITPDTTRTYDEYKQWYWGLIASFNPTDFDPEQWARVSRQAGAKYMVFTSKHHDGFCLFDSKATDFTIAHSAFAGNPREDALRYVFDAFRNEGLMIGCYFSKPDWHSPLYWWPAKATPTRHHNYRIDQYPERWAAYQEYVYEQSQELMHNYGPIDIFWLDGGWCDEPKEDIRLDRIVAMARKAQPGIIVVNRACPGPYEDYQTPEQQIPDHQITTPWESCITLTNDWGWTPNPVYKSANEIIAKLAECTAKGGSLLLGVGPTPTGIIDEDNCQRLAEIGAWLDANGEAIYGTTITDVYTNEDQKVWFTASKDGSVLYAIVPDPSSGSITWQSNTPRRGSKIRNLATGKPLKYTTTDSITTVTLPSSPAPIALKIEI